MAFARSRDLETMATNYCALTAQYMSPWKRRFSVVRKKSAVPEISNSVVYTFIAFLFRMIHIGIAWNNLRLISANLR